MVTIIVVMVMLFAICLFRLDDFRLCLLLKVCVCGFRGFAVWVLGVESTGTVVEPEVDVRDGCLST